MMVPRRAFVAALLWLAVLASLVPVSAQPRIEVGCRAEWDRPTDILMHTPEEELFVGVIHPEAALFERAFDIAGAAAEHRTYRRLLEERGVRVHTVMEALLAGTVDEDGRPLEGQALDDLRAFARTAITIDAEALTPPEREEQTRYLAETLRALHPRELARIVLLRPTVHLRPSLVPNTRYSASYELAPVMNLYFCRDQMITTPKGVVLARMNSEQRAVETDIMRFVLAKLGIEPIYAVTGDGRLEGGDFLPAGDTVFLGQGLRTNSEGVRQLLEHQVFGAKRVVIVKDPWKNQNQMHLDTYFNIAGTNLAVLVEERMDIRDAAGAIVQPARPDRRCTIDVYTLGDGGYDLTTEDGDFQAFLENDMGFTLLPVSDADQLRYAINFLCVDDRELLAVAGASKDYVDRIARAGADATWMDFSNLTGGYGAAHCCTQVLHRVAE